MNQTLHQTLLFASALQVLGADHEIARLLEHAVRTRDPEAMAAGERAIEKLDEPDRKALFDRLDGLWGELPVEVRAA